MICKSVHIFGTFFQYIVHWDAENAKTTKTAFFFFSRAPTYHSLTFDSQFLYELKHIVHPSKTVSRILHIQFHLVFIKLYIFVPKSMDSVTLKRHNSFQIKYNRKTTYSFTQRPRIFMLLQEFWKFNDIFVSWCSPKTDLLKSKYVAFSQY